MVLIGQFSALYLLFAPYLFLLNHGDSHLTSGSRGPKPAIGPKLLLWRIKFAFRCINKIGHGSQNRDAMPKSGTQRPDLAHGVYEPSGDGPTSKPLRIKTRMAWSITCKQGARTVPLFRRTD